MIATGISDVDLWSIAEDTWRAYLDGDGESPLVPYVPHDAEVAGVVASVSMTGAWDGHLVIRLTREAASMVAASMLAIDPPDVTDADVVDAAGELANVVAGNVKSLLPQPSLLALPRVVVGDAVRGYWPGTDEVCFIGSVWQGEPVTMTLLRVDLS